MTEKESMDTFHILYDKLSNELKRCYWEKKNHNGQSNIHLAVKRQYSNTFLIRIISESLRLCGHSGLFYKDNYGDSPIDIIFRPHYPRWKRSNGLVQELINGRIITGDLVHTHKLLHKLVQWPRSFDARVKVKMLLASFHECLSQRNEMGDIPISMITYNWKDWDDIKDMLEILLRFGIKYGVDDTGGGLLFEGSNGLSILQTLISHESSNYQDSNDPLILKRIIYFFSSLLRRCGVHFLPKTMILFPVEVLTELIEAFDDAAYLKDDDGRRLLHIATLKGMGWDGLYKIIEANKEAVVMQDSSTGCYPVFLAAMSCSDVNTIFKLMLVDCFPVISGRSF